MRRAELFFSAGLAPILWQRHRRDAEVIERDLV
jgi:hypothetical protein